MHSLDSRQQNARAAERLEAKLASNDALDDPVTMLDDVVQMLHLKQFDPSAGIGLNALGGSRVGITLGDGDLVRQAVLAAGPFFRF